MDRRELFAKTIGAIAALFVPAVAKAGPADDGMAIDPKDYWIPLKVQHVGERRIFYVDLGKCSKFDQERFMQRMREQFRKAKAKKV